VSSSDDAVFNICGAVERVLKCEVPKVVSKPHVTINFPTENVKATCAVQMFLALFQ
jgi:hypothetical protein